MTRHKPSLPGLRAAARLAAVLAVVLAVVLAALAATSCSLAVKSGKLPEAATAALPSRWIMEPIVILADSSTWTVAAEGDSNVLIVKDVTWYRINRRNPATLETLVFHDDETTERPPRIRLDAWFPDKRHLEKTQADFHRARLDESGLLASNEFESRFRIPGYQEGMILRHQVDEVVTRPQFRSHESLRSGFPCLHRYVAFRAPAAYALKAALSNGEGLPVRGDTVSEGGFRELRYAADSLEKIPDDMAFKYPEERLAAFWFSVPSRGTRSRTWRELGDQYLEMLRPDAEERAGLPADAVPAAGKDPEASARAAFALVQNHVRYLADERKMNAFIPRPAGRVWANGYGDCKEMANLLRAMAGRSKVEMGLALIQSGPGFQLREEFPSLGNFNHMIAWRRGEDGVPRFYDPTVNFGSAPGSSLHLLYQKALLLASGKSVLDTVAPSEGCPNRITTRSRLLRSPGKGSLTLEGEIALKGAAAWSLVARLRYRDTHPEEARAAVRAFLREGFGIEANTVSWAETGSDSIAITYAHGKDLVPEADGLALELPSLYSEWDGAKTGFLPPITQQDEWRLPAGFGKPSGANYRNVLGDLAWSGSKGEAKRSFTGRQARYRCGEEAAGRAVKDSLIYRSVSWIGK